MKIMVQRYDNDSKFWFDTGKRFSTVAEADAFLRSVDGHPYRVRWEDGGQVALVTKGTVGGVFGRLEGESPFADVEPGEPLPPGQHWACGKLTAEGVLVYDAPFATVGEAHGMARQRDAEEGGPGRLFVPLRVVPLSDGSEEACVANPHTGRRIGSWKKPLHPLSAAALRPDSARSEVFIGQTFRFAVWTMQPDGRECSPVDRRPTVERAAELGRRVVAKAADLATRVGIFDTEAKRWVTRDLCGEFGPKREG